MAHCSCSGHASGSCHQSNAQHEHNHSMDGKEKVMIIVSFLMLVSGIVFTFYDLSFFKTETVRFLWYLTAFMPVGIPVFREALESIVKKDFFNEFTLMFIACIGAFIIGEYPEGVAVMLFYAVGEMFQEKAVDKARKNIKSLIDIRPEKAVVIKDDQALEVSPDTVNIGDILEVKTGERVPLDGILINECASFNTAALTGESLPRNINKEENVLAGMIVTDRVVRIKVSRKVGDSALSRILKMVEDAAEKKGHSELLIRRLARIYTPVVTVLAVLITVLPWLYSVIFPGYVFEFGEWFYRSLFFLVLSCPCALVVSIPLSYFSGIGAASSRGILFKGGNYLDAMAQINTVVFDKTGTLTKGEFGVKEIVVSSEYDNGEVLRIIASVESLSNHPIAGAIVKYALSGKTDIIKPENVKEIAGHGLIADVEGKRCFVGNSKLMKQEDIIYPAAIDDIEDTVVILAVGYRFAGYITLSDIVKDDAADAVKDLADHDIHNIYVLSGDKHSIVSGLAESLKIKNYKGDLLPHDKMKEVEMLKENRDNRVAFVGDGINDAPVLALSDVGIAMGGLGSDAAIETADVVIQTDQPSKVALAVRIGKLTKRIIFQNITLAFGVKIFVLLLGFFGYASLWEAVFADVGVSLIAVLNAMRIQKMV